MNIHRSILPFLCLAAATSSAEVVRIDVETRSDVANGKSYGLAGAYERLGGKIYYEIDPNLSTNQIIRDINYAPTNADGKVEFSTDFYLLKPKDIQAGNGAVVFEVVNRGNKNLMRFNFAERVPHPSSAADMGDGFLLRNGFSILWLGWQFDTPEVDGRMRLYPPTAAGDDEPLEGLVRSDFIVTETTYAHSLGDRGHAAYPVSDANDARNVLTVRDKPTAERQVVPRDQWQFARHENNRAVADATTVFLRGGFAPGRIYEVVYVSQNPPITGTGMAAIRDTISLLKYSAAEALSIPNGAIDRSIAYGRSQSGRFLRSYLYDGFNEDEHGNKVFDGVMAQVGGAKRGSFNHRFAQASRANGAFYYPLGIFPFSDAVQTDPLTGERDGLLAGLSADTMPKIFHTNTSTEYWRASNALTHTTGDGTEDFAPIDNARLYFFTGTQHSPAAFPPDGVASDYLGNPNEYMWFMRSLLLSMDRWITDDVSPPASRYPTLMDHTLVELDELRFPKIFDLEIPTEVSMEYVLDFGPSLASDGIITKEPPLRGASYPFLLPALNESGNEIAGLKSPVLAVPLATYTGWQPSNQEGGVGLFVPFARTKAEREANGDPRLSISERYSSRDAYLGVVAEEALGLINDGYLQARDLPAIVQSAGRQWDYLMSGGSPYLSQH
jgi:hypothetical protein